MMFQRKHGNGGGRQRMVENDGRLMIPFIWVAIALSVLLHAAALFGWKPPLDTHMPRMGEGTALTTPLRMRILPVPSGQSGPSTPAIAQRAVPPARPSPAPAARPKTPVIALNSTAPALLATPSRPAAPAPPLPAPTPPTPPVAPRAGSDMMASIQARRRARGESAAPSPAAIDDDKARRDGIVAANLGQDRAPSFGQDVRKQGGGVFQIQREGFDRAEFLFFGWDKAIGRIASQVIEVRKGDNPDIRIAIVRKMIAIIREHEQGDFVWDSRRLGRSLNLSARPADNSGLEEVLMREFFEVRR